MAGTTLTATVTAAPLYRHSYCWTLNKSVSPETLQRSVGNTEHAEYSIAVTKGTGTTQAFYVGEICATNNGDVASQNLKIVVNLTNPPGSVTYNSTHVDVSEKSVLRPGESHSFPYAILLPSPVAGQTYKVTADVTITNHTGHEGRPFGPTPNATATLPSSPTVVNNTIHVIDDDHSYTFDMNNAIVGPRHCSEQTTDTGHSMAVSPTSSEGAEKDSDIGGSAEECDFSSTEDQYSETENSELTEDIRTNGSGGSRSRAKSDAQNSVKVFIDNNVRQRSIYKFRRRQHCKKKVKR